MLHPLECGARRLGASGRGREGGGGVRGVGGAGWVVYMRGVVVGWVGFVGCDGRGFGWEKDC